MVVESIVICVDNSDFMRNEDYLPNRIIAQIDALQVLIYAKLRSNPENYLGLVTLANNEVISHLSNSESKLLTDLSKVEIGGSVRLLSSLNVSQLVLKHRPIKHGKCRIVVFVGSPVDVAENELLLMGKKFKKENVSVDVVTFGNEKGTEVLKVLVDTLNGPSGSANSYTVVPQNAVLADHVVSSGLVVAHREFGGILDAEDDDEELRRAIEWSMMESGPHPPSTPISTATPTGIQDGNDLSDDEQLRLAIQLSLQEAERVASSQEEPRLENDKRTTPPAPDPKSGGSGPGRPTSTSPMNTSNSKRTTPPAPDPKSGGTAPGRPTSTSPTNTSNTDPNTPGNAPSSETNKKDDPPANTNTNPNNNSNNNNNNSAAAVAGNSDPNKTAADNKDTKKSILTKKR